MGGGVLGPVTFCTMIVWKIVREVAYKCKTGSWFKKKNSAWLKDEGSIRWRSLIPLLLNVVFQVGYVFLMTFAWNYATLAGINQGVITVLVLFSSVINCVTFYFYFNEKISKLHLIGIALLCSGTGFIAVSAAHKNEDEEVDIEDRSPLFNSIMALLFGFCAAVDISFHSFVVRKYSDTYQGVDQGLDSRPFCSLIYACFIPALQEKMTIEWKDLLIGGAAGTLMDTAIVFISLAITQGKAGPAQALMSTDSLWQAVCGVIFAGQTMDAWQIASLFTALLGVFSISYFDHLANSRGQNKKLAELRDSISVILSKKRRH